MKKQRFRRAGEDLSVLAAVLLSMGVIAAFTGLWPWTGNPYNSYTLQALSWLEGRLDVENRVWLELAVYGGKYYVSFPPFPSYVLLPFAALFGENTPDGWIALCVTALGALTACRLYRRLRGGADRDGLGFWVLFLYLGTGYLFIAMNGYVWFIAQTLCFTLCLISLDTALSGRGGLSLAALACAAGCRPMVLLYLPVIAYLLLREQRARRPEEGNPFLALLRRRWYWAVAPLIIGGSYMALNYARFGSVTEFGHNYLPEFTRTAEGQFHLSYLAGNLKKLLRLPSAEGGVLRFPNADGFAFWLADPFYIAAPAAWISALIRGRRGERAPFAADASRAESAPAPAVFSPKEDRASAASPALCGAARDAASAAAGMPVGGPAAVSAAPPAPAVLSPKEDRVSAASPALCGAARDAASAAVGAPMSGPAAASAVPPAPAVFPPEKPVRTGLTREEADGPWLRALLPLCSALYVLVLCLHRTLGGWQFGVRYLLDLLPFLFTGTLVWMPREERFRRWMTPLAVLGFALNVLGAAATYARWI